MEETKRPTDETVEEELPQTEIPEAESEPEEKPGKGEKKKLKKFVKQTKLKIK